MFISNFDDFMIGSMPIDEEGDATNETTHRYKALLDEYFSNVIPEGARFVVKNNPHDFGDYKTVNVKYSVGNHEDFYLIRPHYEDYLNAEDFKENSECKESYHAFIPYWFSLFVECEAPKRWNFTSEQQYEMELRWWEQVLWKNGIPPVSPEKIIRITVDKLGNTFKANA